GGVEPLGREVDRRPVMGGEEEVADRLAVVAAEEFADGDEVAEALGHLLGLDRHEAVVHPVTGEGSAVGGLALRDLVFVVREDEVLAAAMDVEGLAQVAGAHGGALDVPTGTPRTPWALPG